MFSWWSAWRGFQMGLGRQAEKCMVMFSSKMLLWGAKLTFAGVYFKNKSHLGNTLCLGINIFSWKRDLNKNRLCVTAYCTYSSFSFTKEGHKNENFGPEVFFDPLRTEHGKWSITAPQQRMFYHNVFFLMGNPTPPKGILYPLVLKFYCTTCVYPELSFFHLSENTSQ